MNLSKLITISTSILVLVIAITSFALSYHALQGIAQSYGLDGWLSYLWPLLIDFALVVFSLCVVTAHLHGEGTWRQWLLVGLATGLTCSYNYLHAPDNLIAQTVAIVPPVMLFFSFELLMNQLKNSISRQVSIPDKVVTSYEPTQDIEDNAQVLIDNIGLLTLPDIILTDSVATRRSKILTLRELNVTQSNMAKRLGVSLSTIRNDLKALNGHH